MKQMSDEMANPGSIMLLHKISRGGVICDAALACSIGALLFERHYGADELARQQPLMATDKGECWRVEGNWNRAGEAEGSGPLFLTIAKFDGRITDFGQWGPSHPLPVPLASR